jgi:plastocyanin
MKLKLIVSLLVICLAFSFGSTQAQTEEDNTSQAGNLSGEEGNLSTDGNISKLANKTVNVSQESGGEVKWILPGPRRLDPEIFGTPEMPLGFEEGIGVPIENRSLNDEETEFNTTTEDTPYSDNYSLINGSFTMNLTDMTPVDVNESNDTAEAEFNFTDPTGEIEYRVVLTNITHVGKYHSVLGGVLIDGIVHGKSSIDSRMEPTSYAYGAFWGVGELYVNGTLVSDNRVVHSMVTERVRSPDEEGYRLLFDKELPHQGVQTHLVLPDMVMADNGTIDNESVPTNYTLPNGEEQPFIHVMFDEPRLEGLEVLNFMNVTGNITDNMTGNITGNMTDNMTGNMTGNATGEEIVEVSINDFAFDPESVTISTGDTVRWTNMDSANHTATGSTFDSGILEEGDSYEFTFTETGTFEYYCSIHPEMEGTVTVTAGNMTDNMNEDDTNEDDMNEDDNTDNDM